MKTYTLDDDLKPIMDGKIDLPNFEAVPDDQLKRKLSNLTLGGIFCPPHAGWVRIPGEPSKHWARYFLHTTQGGSFDGTGHVIYYASGKQSDGKDFGFGIGIFGTFAICVHKKVEGADANHTRGWHPGHCEKCGMDMSVDSGD